MKYAISFPIAFLSSVLIVSANDQASGIQVLSSPRDTVTVKADNIAARLDSNEIVAVEFGPRRELKPPSEIPNVYKGDYGIDIPNAHKDSQDRSLPIPNHGLEESADPESKNKPVPKLAPKFLPDTAK